MTEKEQWNKYLEWSYDEFFSHIKPSDSVLEIGPAVGYHSNLIQRQNPRKHICVEPNEKVVDTLEEIVDDVFCCHYEDFYNHDRRYDVVVCCGVLYHILSPLNLLEKITNLSRPDKIILSNIKVDDDGVEKYTYEHEHLGRHDREYYNNPIKYWHKLKSDTVKEVLESQDYKCIKELDTTKIWPKYVYYWQEYERT